MSFNLNNSIAILGRTPDVLRTLLSGLSHEWTHHNEGGDSWSPFDVIGHLIDGDETDWMARLRIILGQGSNRKFEPFDRFRHLQTNKGKSLEELLARFSELRAKNLADLKALNLNDGHLRLTGEHPEFGTVTLEQLLATWVVHDLDHLAQISRVMGKQYRKAVGPWEQYLSVLHR